MGKDLDILFSKFNYGNIDEDLIQDEVAAEIVNHSESDTNILLWSYKGGSAYKLSS